VCCREECALCVAERHVRCVLQRGVCTVCCREACALCVVERHVHCVLQRGMCTVCCREACALALNTFNDGEETLMHLRLLEKTVRNQK